MARAVVRQRRTRLDLSATSVKSNEDLATVYDHRDSAPAFGILKHLFHPGGVLGHVDVPEKSLTFAVVLTGGCGVRSGILPKDQHRVCHARKLLVWDLPFSK